MVKGKNRQQWKNDYFEKAQELLTKYPRLFIVDADNVSSKQFQDIRRGLRGQADILMGKNTMMKKVIRGMLGNNPDLEKLLPHIRKNIGFVLTGGDLKEIRDLVMSYKVQAPARAGAMSDVHVKVPPQNTGLGPEKTSFFQALSIPTKISRGTIEITGEVHLLRPGDRVGASESALLNMLKISPFTYGLDIVQVYDSGSCFAPDVLDITEEDVRARFCSAVQNVAAVSLAIGYPTLASVPHSVANGFKNLMAVAAATSIEFPEVETLKAYLADPSAFAVATPVAAAAAEEAPKEVAAKEESEEDSDEDMFGMDMFG
jgi:large subunit ribosomal protein LP0